MILIPLKLKYRERNRRAAEWPTSESRIVYGHVWMCATPDRHSNNSGKARAGRTIRPRRRAYGPF